jgi:peptidoglycan/xylan/chitin deacetylase (PgdA/CDA1 family)
VQYLSQRYNLVSLIDFVKILSAADQSNFPKNALLITLDDGWKENYDLLPVIRKYKFRPTVFITSQMINTERHFWWTECPASEVGQLKRMPNKQRLEILKTKYQYDPVREYTGRRQALNWDEITVMKNFVDFGLHSKHHPVLTQCSTEEKRDEIVGCKTETEKMFGCKIEAFAYPNGDYNTECIRILKECGLKVARTTDAGWNNFSADPYKLKITGASDDGSVTKLAAELTGIPGFFQHLIFSGSFNGLKNKNER